MKIGDKVFVEGEIIGLDKRPGGTFTEISFDINSKTFTNIWIHPKNKDYIFSPINGSTKIGDEVFVSGKITGIKPVGMNAFVKIEIKGSAKREEALPEKKESILVYSESIKKKPPENPSGLLILNFNSFSLLIHS